MEPSAVCCDHESDEYAHYSPLLCAEGRFSSVLCPDKPKSPLLPLLLSRQFGYIDDFRHDSPSASSQHERHISTLKFGKSEVGHAPVIQKRVHEYLMKSIDGTTPISVRREMPSRRRGSLDPATTHHLADWSTCGSYNMHLTTQSKSRVDTFVSLEHLVRRTPTVPRCPYNWSTDRTIQAQTFFGIPYYESLENACDFAIP